MKRLLISLMAATILHIIPAISAEYSVRDSCCDIIISRNQFKLAYNDALKHILKAPLEYNSETDAIHFTSLISIKDIVIINMNTKAVEYILPVEAKKVRISMGLFGDGHYKLKFDFKDYNDGMMAYVLNGQ